MTIWVLGLSVLVLALGGLSIDLWRGISERRALYHTASAGALAGASGIDTHLWRATGLLALDPDVAQDLAREAVEAQPGADELSELSLEVGADAIRVAVARPLEFTLFRLVGLSEITIRAWAEAEPRLVP